MINMFPSVTFATFLNNFIAEAALTLTSQVFQTERIASAYLKVILNE